MSSKIFYKIIIDPISNNEYDIQSNKGKVLLKKYKKYYVNK